MEVRKGTIKKPKFLISYLVSAIILLLILFVVRFIFWIPTIYEYEEDIEYMRSAARVSVSREVWGDEKFEGPVRVRVKAQLVNHYLSTGQRVRYQSDDVGMVDATETATVIYMESLDSEIEEYLELADKKYLESFKSEEALAMRYYESYNSNLNSVPYNYFLCNELYVDVEHGKFIPVEIELLDNSLERSGVTIRFTPENTDGYTYVKCDYDDPDNSPYASGIAGGYDGVDLDSDYELKDESTVPPYEKYYATPLEPVPFTTVYKEEITWTIFEIVWLALFLALVPAIISYNIKLRRYQIFEYRRQMVDAMAHDLKTPMAAISAYSENLSNHIGTDKQEYYAGKIEEKVSQMNTMVNDMLEFSKSENKSAVITKEDVDISDVITGIISGNEHAITERSLKINYDKKNVVIKTDKKLFEQAISNLIGNAILYSKEGTAIDIECDSDSLTITNISAEKLENVKSLKQAFTKGSLSRGSKGTGLGLAIADNNLVMLKYKLDIQSDGDKFIATVKL